MTAVDLQEQLTKSYEREKWLSLVRDVLPSAQPYASPQAVPVGDIKAKAIWHLGEVQLADGRRVALLELEVEPGTDLARNRVGLRQLAVRFIDLARFHSVLTTYHAGESSAAEGAGRWRLTFALREATLDNEGQIAVRETAPKRFTYLLGKGEPCRTPAERLFRLAELGRTAETKHLEEAFSVEALNREFFRKFKDIFDVLTAELRDHFPKWKKPELSGERDPAAEEAQTLLNRLLFLSFVQRKGWLHRDQKYLSRHFHDKHSKRNGMTYYSEFLSHVFEIVSTEWNARDRAVSHLPEHDPRTHDLPFLNGGLFQDDDPNDDDTRRRRGLAISNTTFARLFEELFDAYNFTIREDSPLDIEVAVDPEMLGKIFEELILSEELGTAGKARRHDTGSHYTPRSIVHYLCREALAAWLERRAPFAGHDDAPARIRSLLTLDASEGVDEATRAQLRELLDKGAAEVLLRQLDEVRACDPAVGSGAFPMGLLYELLNLAHLATTCARGRDPADANLAWAYDLRKHFILSALYGVDIQPVPVEICKLRLWLSLLVDHELRVSPLDCTRREFQSALKALEPLPNLDFKIRRANSLVDTIHGQPVEMQRLSGDARSRQPMLTLASAKRDFFDADSQPKKRALRLAIADAYADLAEIELGWQKVERGLSLGDNPNDSAKTLRLDAILREIRRFRGQMKGAHRKLNAAEQERLLNEIAAFFDSPDAPTFVWRLDFAEAFFPPAGAPSAGDLLSEDTPVSKRADRTEPSGFSLVIGNPPYVRPHRLSAETKELLWSLYETYVKKSDLYCCFIECSIRSILMPGGCLSFITGNGYLRLDSFEVLRKFLLRETRIRRLVDFTDNVFESAAVRTALMVVTRETPCDSNIEVATVSSKADLWTHRFSSLPQSKFRRTYKHVFDVAMDATSEAAKAQMWERSKSIEQRGFQLSFGLKTGDDDKFLTHAPTTTEHRKLIRGEDAGRYQIEFKGEYVWYVPDRMRAHRTTARPGTADRFEQPKVLVRDTGGGLRATFDPENFYVKDMLVVADPLKCPAKLKYLTGVLNSRPERYYYETTFPTIHVQRDELASLPIPDATDLQQLTVAALVDYILFMYQQPSVYRSSSNAPRDRLAAQYFERWVDGLMYQLYFPEKLALAGLDFLRLHAEASLPSIETIPRAGRLPALREIYERLSEPNHPLRGAFFALDSVPVVKLVEGRA